MNTKQAAELWHTTIREVAKCCREGFVEGAEKEGRPWQIPNNAVRPYRFAPNQAEHQIGKKILILLAISSERVIPYNKLSQTPGRVELLFTELINQGLLMRIQDANDEGSIFRNHMLTPAGETFKKENGTFEKIMKKLPQFNIHFHLQG